MMLSPEAYVVFPGAQGTTGVSIWQDKDILHAQCTRCGSDIYWHGEREHWYCSDSDCEIDSVPVPREAGMSMTGVSVGGSTILTWISQWTGIPKHLLTVEVEEAE